ncbi:odorant receptor 131-2-like [Antennarius striatus]|uniref:odorant receptor 131-2-like n=1 Tax=Antennarius striatus TaxID=241820 RepID=UPI0035B1E270
MAQPLPHLGAKPRARALMRMPGGRAFSYGARPGSARKDDVGPTSGGMGAVWIRWQLSAWGSTTQTPDKESGDIVEKWKEYFEDLLNPATMSYTEEAEAEVSEVESSFPQAEVTKVVAKLLGGTAPGVAEICSKYLKSLDLHTLHRVLEGSWECAQPVHMCFVDLEKVFDHDPRDMNITAIPKFPVRSPEPLSKVLTKNLLVLLLGVSITCINASFIHVFSKHQIFYLNPRYILFIHLVLNDMIQVMLTVILYVISYTIHKIKFSICCFIILITLFATENTPLNVACMAIECYIAIRFPLRHSRICTIKKTLTLIGLIWMTSMSVVLPDLFVTLATQPLDFFHSHFSCNRHAVFPNPVFVKKRYIIHSVFLVIIWFTIFYTYFRILFTARAASKDSKKARNTIILHGFQVLLYMAKYVGPHLRDVIQQHFLVNIIDSMFAFYIIVHILPRSISPIIYGVRDETFRKYLKKYMLCKCSFTKNNS